jgi:hypothetical protein
MPTKPRRSTSSSGSKICRPWSITASAASVIRGYLGGLSRPEQVEYANNRQINCKQGRISCQFARLPLSDQSRHQSNETLRERKCETTKQRQLRSNRQPEHSPAATGRFAIALSYRRSLWSTKCESPSFRTSSGKASFPGETDSGIQYICPSQRVFCWRNIPIKGLAQTGDQE